MTETAKPKRGGRAYHSILEPHFEFIREMRRRRKTWREIAELLSTEKGIRVTFYAPYLYCKRRLNRPKPHWEDVETPLPPTTLATSQPPSRPASRAPLPPEPAFKRPDRSKLENDEHV